MSTRGKKNGTGIPDGLFFVLIGIMGGIILFSFDKRQNYAFYDSFQYLMQHTPWNEDDTYLPPSHVLSVTAPAPAAKAVPVPTPKVEVVPAVQARLCDGDHPVPQSLDAAYGGRPALSGYSRRYCVPLELGGSHSLENTFYQSPPEAGRRDQWVQKFTAGYCAGKVPLAAAQDVFAHRCDPGEW